MLCSIHKWNISRAFDSGKPLAGLTNLTDLSLDLDLVADLTPLATLVNLTSLSLEAKQIAEKLGKSVAIKAQVTATGRLRAGGVGFANTPDEAEEVAERILRSDIKGFVVKEVLVEEKLDVEKMIPLEALQKLAELKKGLRR